MAVLSVVVTTMTGGVGAVRHPSPDGVEVHVLGSGRQVDPGVLGVRGPGGGEGRADQRDVRRRPARACPGELRAARIGGGTPVSSVPSASSLRKLRRSRKKRCWRATSLTWW